MNTGVYSNHETVLAYFPSQTEAENAISELRSAGFRADQIGCSCDEDYQTSEAPAGRRSFWDKVGDFFTGNEHEDQRAGGNAPSPSVRVPDRYKDRLASGGIFVSVSDTQRRAEAEQILRRKGGTIETDFTGFESAAGPLEGERRIQLLSEQLRIRKERVSQGEVKLRKEIHTEQKSIQVPVTREELVVEHVPTTERSATGREIGGEQEIRVPLSEERVTVQKEPVVRDEVRVAKRPVEGTQNVSDQVRHEELRVEDERKAPGPKSRKSA